MICKGFGFYIACVSIRDLYGFKNNIRSKNFVIVNTIHSHIYFAHRALLNTSGDCTPISSSVNKVKSKTLRPRDEKHQATKSLVIYPNGVLKSNILT